MVQRGVQRRPQAKELRPVVRSPPVERPAYPYAWIAKFYRKLVSAAVRSECSTGLQAPVRDNRRADAAERGDRAAEQPWHRL